MNSSNLISALQFQNHKELGIYFDREPFKSIDVSFGDVKKTMLDEGYISNVTTKFWRLLHIRKMLWGKMTDMDYCDFLLEAFLNQALSCTDTTATFMNHFLNLGLSGSKLAIQNEKFIGIIQDKLQGFEASSELHLYHSWVAKELYP